MECRTNNIVSCPSGILQSRLSLHSSNAQGTVINQYASQGWVSSILNTTVFSLVHAVKSQVIHSVLAIKLHTIVADKIDRQRGSWDVILWWFYCCVLRRGEWTGAQAVHLAVMSVGKDRSLNKTRQGERRCNSAFNPDGWKLSFPSPPWKQTVTWH